MADTWRTVDRFSSSYYSGLDIRVYLGDVCLTDIVGLAFEIRENATPIYGYASYRYDRVARGIRVVQGQFTINFRKPYWLLEETRRALRTRIAEIQTNADRATAAILPSAVVAKSYSGVLNWVEAQWTKFWQEEYRRTRAELNEFQTQSGGIVPSRRLEQDSESPLWDTRGVRYDLRIRYNDPTIRRNQILVTLAEDESAMLLGRDGPDVTSLTEVVSDVQITGVSRAFDDSGRNLLEAYSFIARDYKIHI